MLPSIYIQGERLAIEPFLLSGLPKNEVRRTKATQTTYYLVLRVLSLKTAKWTDTKTDLNCPMSCLMSCYCTCQKSKNKHVCFPMIILFASIMASGRKRVRFTVDVALPSEAAKTAFKDRLSSVRDLFSL